MVLRKIRDPRSRIKPEKAWRNLAWLPKYEISEDGDVWNGFRLLRGYYNCLGYRIYRLVTPELGYSWPVKAHRLVCEAFHGPMQGDRIVVAHNDGNPRNNHYSNLRWATQQENVLDSIKHGRRPKIRVWRTPTHSERYAAGMKFEADLAEMFRAKGFECRHVPGSGCRTERGDLVLQTRDGEELRVEAKSQKVLPNYLINQDCPVTVAKSDDGQSIAIIKFDHFLKLLGGDE